MFDIQIADHPLFAPSSKPHPSSKLSGSRHSSSQHNSESVRSGPNSGWISKKSFGPLTPLLQVTDLITSSPLGSGTLSSGPKRSSGQLEHMRSMSKSKVVYGSAITTLTNEVKVGFRVSKVEVWVFMVAAAMGLLVGGFLMVVVKKWVILIAMALFWCRVGGYCLEFRVANKRALLGFMKMYPDDKLKGAIDGQYIKVTRKYASDFKILDFQSGLRALVKAGYGAKVTPFVKPETWWM